MRNRLQFPNRTENLFAALITSAISNIGNRTVSEPSKCSNGLFVARSPIEPVFYMYPQQQGPTLLFQTN